MTNDNYDSSNNIINNEHATAEMLGCNTNKKVSQNVFFLIRREARHQQLPRTTVDRSTS